MQDQVGQQDVLPPRQRIGLDPDQGQQAADDVGHLVLRRRPQRLPLGPAQRPDQVEAHAAGRSGRVHGDRHLGVGAQLLLADACPLQPLAPARRGRHRQVIGAGALACRQPFVDPGPEVGGGEVGEAQAQVGHVPLGIDDEGGDPGQQRLLDGDHPQARLARPGHADDDAVGGQVLRRDRDPVARLLPLRRRGGAHVQFAHPHPSLVAGPRSAAQRHATPPAGSGARPHRL